MKYLLAILIIILASYSDIFLFKIGIIPLTPSYSVIPFFIIIAFTTYPFHHMLDIIKSHTFKILATILFLSIVFAAIGNASQEVIIEKISLNLITCFIYIICVHFFRTSNKTLVLWVLICALIVLGGSVIYDMFVGLPKYSKELSLSVRKGGFAENPNQAASALKFLAIAGLVFLSNNKLLKNFVVIFMTITVFLTLSRSGLVSVVFILMLGAINNWDFQFKISPKILFQRLIRLVILFAVIFVSLIAVADILRDNIPALNRGEAGKRLDLLTGQADNETIKTEAISGGREVLFLSYLNDFKENPFGYGTGYSADKKANGNKLNTHNYYLYMAINYGFLALIFYLFYVFYNIKVSIKNNQFYYLIFSILFILEGFFTHSIFHERSIIICLALFDSQIYKSSNFTIKPSLV